MDFEAFYQFFRSLWVLWLMLIFISIFAWAFWPKNKERLEAYGRIPLDDDKGEF